MEIHARTILPLLAVMLIPTIAVFFGIKKAFTQEGNKKIIREEIRGYVKLSLLDLNSYEVMSILLI